MLMILIGIAFSLIGGALIETPIIGYINGEYGMANVIFGAFCGLIFLGPGVVMIVSPIKDMIERRWKLPLKDVIEALSPNFKEAEGEGEFDPLLLSFREHYSEFLKKRNVTENEKIQNDVTQVFRNIIQFRKNRLKRLGLTCEIKLKRMAYTVESGISTNHYTDGKYSITDISEEIAAQTIYSKDNKRIYKKIDKELANYTITSAKQVGDDTIICPNCGAETTRNALLDGCDFCGTKFTVEDLGTRIAVFAFRPDAKLRYEKYARTRNRALLIAIIAAVLAVVLGFTIYAIYNAPTLFKEADGGIILTLLASIFSIIIASPIYILSVIVVNAKIIIPLVLILGTISFFVAKKMRAKKNTPMLDRSQEDTIREFDPNFSVANFYSGLQNKLSSVIYAENNDQIQAFAQGNLTGLLGKYSNVVGVDVDHMDITTFYCDNDFQHADVDAFLFLTRYTGKKCTVKREKMHIKLVKDVACKTQIICPPAVMKCSGCGASLDFLQGKRCTYCNHELDLSKYDWVIQSIE